MSVITVTEKRRRSSFKPPADREHTVDYTVLCSLPQEDPKTVKSHSSIPQEGTACPFDAGAICKSVTAEQDEEQPRVWSVECVFTADVIPGMSTDQGGSSHLGPLSQPPIFRFSTIKVMESRSVDRDGKAYKTSAGSPIEGIEVETSHCVMVISHNEASYYPLQETWVLDCINKNEWLGFPIYSLKYTDVNAEESYEEAIHFWRVTRQFEFNPQLWDPARRIDRGPMYLLPGSNEPIVALDDNGVTHTNQVFLDGEGHKLSAEDVKAGNYHWLEFADYYTYDFSNLNLYK